MIKVPLFICLSLSFGSPKDSIRREFNPISVQKKIVKKVYAHLMPWFETKQTNEPAGTWGSHWTMANQNPDSITAEGKRQIASHYYPLTGPYASGDPDIIEYQLLLMKYSGIDGVCIDWPGITALYDYPMLVRNTEKIILMIGKVGLHFAIVYEDQDIDIAYKKGIVKDKITAARDDMEYLQAHYFTDSSYERFGKSPLLLDFGPQTFLEPKEWTDIFSVLSQRPSFFTLWDHEKFAGNNATGAFAWINADHMVSLRHFYAIQDHGPYIASAYPGFNTFYAEGGWGGPTFKITADHLKTFTKTLDLALESSAAYIQVPTWNDYGEGTMIEPTLEFHYDFLTALQHKLGVPYTQTELELVAKLYNLRKRYAVNDPIQKKLDDVFAALASLQTEKAASLMNKL